MKQKIKRLWCWLWHWHDYGGFDQNNVVVPDNLKDLSANQTVYLISLSALYYCHRCGKVFPESEKRIAEVRSLLSEAELAECEKRWESLKVLPRKEV